ncbi:hypothetical protein LJD42_29045, partial [Escherichia coli]|nr:hypothetical protein [Escherichia coli]
MMLAVASQPPSGGSTFATGADVSRFQRSTVPGKANGAAGMTPQGVTQATVSTGMPGDASGLPMGPVVRIARGTTVTVVPVGGQRIAQQQTNASPVGATNPSVPMGGNK